MAQPHAHHRVCCYHCGHPIGVGATTMSTSCPGCNKPVLTEDVVVSGYKAVMSVETCGRLIVRTRGHVVAQKRVIAHAGIELQGKLHCSDAVTAGHVSMGRKAQWRGDLAARSLSVEDGASILGGHFTIPGEPLEKLRKQGPRPGRGRKRAATAGPSPSTEHP